MVKITETVLRDGHQSLIATRMRTEDMLPIVEKMDKVGFFSLEMWGGATFDVCLRFLNEDPWERIRKIRGLVKNTKLQMLLRGQNLVGYRHYPDDVVIKFVQKSRDNGIDIFRIFDALNDIRNVETAIRAAKKTGATVEGAISYTVSPIHTIEKYVKFAFELKELGSDIICIKDMSGIITPTAAYDLINMLKKEVNLPVHLHTHCASGMAPIVYLTACEAGVDYLDTAVSPFGWGTSQPPTESIVGALKGTPFDTGLDLNIIVEVSEYFQKVRDKYRALVDPISERIDPKIMIHQIPGGMMSNLISQLKEQDAMDKLPLVLEETAKVRKDLGYPPLVTPTSQMVGTQAVFNVVLGERYKMISNEVKDYVKGLYGKPPGQIEESVRHKAIGSEEPISNRPADNIQPEWQSNRQEVKELLGSDNPSDEEVFCYALFPVIAKEFWARRAAGLEPEMPQDEVVTAGPDSENAGNGNLVLELDNQKYSIKITPQKDKGKHKALSVEIKGRKYEVNVLTAPRPVKAETLASQSKPVKADSCPKAGNNITIALPDTKTGAAVNVMVPMSGKIVSIKVREGDRVKKGDMLFILEAMKMQNEIGSPADGIVKSIAIKTGDNVDNQASLMQIESHQG